MVVQVAVALMLLPLERLLEAPALVALETMVDRQYQTARVLAVVGALVLLEVTVQPQQAALAVLVLPIALLVRLSLALVAVAVEHTTAPEALAGQVLAVLVLTITMRQVQGQ